MSDIPERLIAEALAMGEAAAAARFRGPDPYDGLWWRWPRALAGGPRRRQALVQLHARSPVNVRRLYRHQEAAPIPKAAAVFASVGARAHRLSGPESPLRLALEGAEHVAADRRAGSQAWGYHWDVQTRWSFYPAGSPNVVVTAFAVVGLIETAIQAERGDLIARAQEAARWVLDELWVEPSGYFAYHPGQPTNVHNANLLGAWLVHIAAADEPAAARRVARAVERTLAAQRPDGSWPYGEARNLGWADSFHSGYVLGCLDRLSGVDPSINAAIARGAEHYRTFFGADGRAQLWAHRPYPEDGHSAGTGLSTLSLLLRRGLIEQELLERVVQRVLDMGIRRGHAVHRRYRRGRTTVRYLRWCDAHVALGLVDAAAALGGEPDLAPVSSAGA